MTIRAILLAALGLTCASSDPLFSQKPYRGAEYRTIAAVTYGRFEVRMRTAQVSGMLSSFFTFYDPANPWNEIDIESMGRYSNEIQFNTIVPVQGVNHVQRQPLQFNPHAAFHVYAIEWTPDAVAWCVDGVEVYRQTDSFIGQINMPQKLMMNIWQPNDVGWAGTFNAGNLPVYAYYDWVKYYAYTPGAGDNFTLQWTDNFDAYDPSRWQRATHTWDGNNCQFVQENVAFANGKMILCMTDLLHSGYGGGTVIDADIDPPYPVSARASYRKVRVLFSEGLDRPTAELASNYVLPGATIQGAQLLADGRSVDLLQTGLNLSGSTNLIVLNVRDLAGNNMGAKSVRVVMPLPLPLRIDVGGPATTGSVADSTWYFAGQYGAVGGTVTQAAPGTEIAGTSDDSLYRSAREGLTFYNIRVPTDRTYEVRLLFAETRVASAGARVFDVSVNGETRRIDIFQNAGANAAWIVPFSGVAAPDGIIALAFTPVADRPILSGIVVDTLLTGVEEDSPGKGGAPLGLNVFPNPFNGDVTFSLFLPNAGEATLELYDLLGRKVSSLPLGFAAQGGVSLRWSLPDLASGVYLCSLSSGGETRTKRLLLLR